MIRNNRLAQQLWRNMPVPAIIAINAHRLAIMANKHALHRIAVLVVKADAIADAEFEHGVIVFSCCMARSCSTILRVKSRNCASLKASMSRVMS